MAGITGNGAPDTDDYGGYNCEVNSIVNYYGPVDVAKMSDNPSVLEHSSADSPEGYLLGRVPVLENMELVKAANPVTYLSTDRECPPVLTIHGDSDMVVPFEQGIIIHEALVNAGKHSEIYKLLGAGHGTEEFWTDETFDVVEGFIRKYDKN